MMVEVVVVATTFGGDDEGDSGNGGDNDIDASGGDGNNVSGNGNGGDNDNNKISDVGGRDSDSN